MKTFVITGGTDGIGKELARTFLDRGDEVVVVGRNAEKGAAFLATAAELDAADRAHFLLADLSLVAENRKVLDELRSGFPKIDTLILGARHYRSSRAVTAEGFEHAFALYYLSRFLLGYGLTEQLDAAENPLILNLCGPGAGTGEIHWDDLGLERNYDGSTTLVQGGALNDLLGIGFAKHRTSAKVRYVLFHPGVVSTSFSGQYDAEVAAQIEYMRRTAKPVGQAIVPILEVLDNPPSEPVSAFMTGEPVSLDGLAFDADSAERLHAETEKLLSRKQSVSPGKLKELLDSPVFATVATIQPDGSPHQSIVWVKRDGDDVLFLSAIGSRKERNLRRDPRVGVLISPPEAPYTYAAIHGTATLETLGSKELRDELTMKYVGKSYAQHIEDTPEAGADRREVTAVRVTPGKIVGRL